MSRNRKLRKSKDRILAGVAGGIAEFIGWEPRQIRAIWVAAGFLTGGTAVIVYTVCAFVFPPPSKFNLDDFREQ